ncbi:hypothetical protein [Brevundimonas faecalis]|uniref:Uncharacterized protein n=1 Tax=Brevundimonas faecalis TaxID=947378 RepID=A0ABV2RE66_9CAUL
MPRTTPTRKGKRFLPDLAEPFRSILLILVIVPPGVIGIGALCIGLLFAAEGMGRSLTFEEAFNGVLAVLMALFFLPLCHAGTYRWFWHIEKKRQAGHFLSGAAMPDAFSEPTEPPPAVPISLGQRTVYALLYLAAIGLLLFVYLPLGHQAVLQGFIARFSSGRASAGSLATLLTAWLPLLGGMAVVMLALEGDMKKIRSGLLDPTETLRLQGRVEWLGAFVTAFAMTSLLCFMFGAMIARYLG